MNNRVAFIDFIRGLLTINPLERWSPQQAKLHPFITQQKFTGPFVPPMNIKTSSSNRSPAPGTQQQQQAEALSKQRAQQAQAQLAQQQQQHQAQAQAHAQAQAQAQAAHAQAQAAYAPQAGGNYAPQPHPQAQMYSQPPPGSMYPPSQNAPPPYPTQGGAYPTAMQPPMPGSQYGPSASQSMYAQATTRAGRQRATTMEQQQGGIPAAIQRVASHLDPTQPIRLQPSPAYYPPPPDGAPDGNAGSARRRGSRAAQGSGQTARSNRDFIRNLEDRTLEEGFLGQQGQGSQWH